MYRRDARAARGSLPRAAIAAMGVAATLATVSAGTAHATALTPAYHAGNVNSCADIEPGAYGVNVDAPSKWGTFGDDKLGGAYDVSADRKTFAWSSTAGSVSFVVVKGGPDAYVYDYDGGAKSDSGLVSPLNRGGQVPAISHVLLCRGEKPPTPPTPPTPPAAKGRIVIEKKTLPTGADTQFTFHPSADLSSSDFQLTDRGQKAFEAAPGTYTVQELPTAGWTLTKLSCDDADSSEYGSTARIRVSDGETVVCTFTNTKDVVDNPPVDNPPVDNPPVDNPPVDNPPVNNPPVNNPPAGTPPSGNGPVTTPASDNPIATTPVSVPIAASAVAPAVSAPARTPAQGIAGTRVARGTARLRLPACSTGLARVTIAGSPMRRIVFSVDGRRVRTLVVPAGRRSVTVSLPSGKVSARVTFRNGATARTLRATTRRCAARVVRPQFTG
jgi:hypothetical protein